VAGYSVKLVRHGTDANHREMPVPQVPQMPQVPQVHQVPQVPRLLPVRLSIASGLEAWALGVVVVVMKRFIVHASAAARRALKLFWEYRRVHSIITSLDNANWDIT
jgi:hypothetical protein